MATEFTYLDNRPILICLAGPNGAGKSTFYEVYLRRSGIRYINPDVISCELNITPYTAAEIANNVRLEIVRQKESFIFETVFSDPVGDKLQFLENASRQGYTVQLIFIGIESVEISDERVAMRVSQNGHDVPFDKLESRFPRTLRNLKQAIKRIDYVIIYDNSDLQKPYNLIAIFEYGNQHFLKNPLPNWFIMP